MTDDAPLEDHNSISESGERGGSRIAIVVAVLAATLALSANGEKSALTDVLHRDSIVNDLWAEYQAKSIKSAVAGGIGALATALSEAPGQSREAGAPLSALSKDMQQRVEHYETGGPTGKEALSKRAKAESLVRDRGIERLHEYELAGSALQIAIVLAATSSALRGRSRNYLLAGAVALGLAGAALTIKAAQTTAILSDTLLEDTTATEK